MALYGYTVIAGIIIWCGVAMGTRGRAGIFIRGERGSLKCPPYVQKKAPPMYKKAPPYVQKRPPICTKKAPQMEKKVAKMPPHGKTSFK